MNNAASNEWFDGPVADAVAQVLIHGIDDTENSKKLDDTLSNETECTSQVIECFKSKTVALKMHANSDNAALFKQLYPIHHVPVLYIIRQGIVKDFAAENITAEEIIAKVEEHSSNPVPQPSPPRQQQQEQQQQQQQQQSSSPVPLTNIGISEPVVPVQALDSSVARSSSDDTDAKRQRARKQIEESRKKREEEEKKKARENEIKRREEGKTIQKTRQELEEKQNKLYFEKLKKEKREEEEHRKKIKEQIARDRAEQLAARQTEKQRKKAGRDAENASGSPNRASSSHDHSSISIRQLDGSTIRNKFKAADPLAFVKDWVDQNRTDGDQPYKLLAQFPTRQFSIGDEARTLRELDLCPSATLIMKGIKNVSNAYGTNSSYSVMDYVYSAGGVLYNAASAVGSSVSGVMQSFFPADTTPSAAASSSSPSSSHHASAGQRLGGGLPATRSRSNISTIHNSAFADNDNDGRYNGNSLNQE
ncbi:hypothetical protein BX666DRAFT_2025732 [Dichotomocladium elegans]|nr:hypothetical protein BX666DRAFT_2025732 [Dichotomocladium elegans]